MTKKIEPQTLKGFRDFLPEEMVTRQKVINTLKKVFESYGFQPLETPALEYAETLLGKYGPEADRLIYKFKDRGGRDIGLRYDLTVPLARVIASYPTLIQPFKRYQIQPVWRAEKPQSGRFREFLQCDADIVSGQPSLADAEIITLAANSLEKLGVSNFRILINDRRVLSDALAKTSLSRRIINKSGLEIIRSLDKLEKIGKAGTKKELAKKGFSGKQSQEIIEKVEQAKPTRDLKQIFGYFKQLGLSENQTIFSPTLARGLDYYTGMIFEVKIDGYTGGSVAGGGRYDLLISFLIGEYKASTTAVGFSFGIDRLIEAMKGQGLFKNLPKTNTKVLVTIFSPEYLEKSIEVTTILRSSNKVNTELYLDPEAKLDKQLKYADRKGIPFVIILGPEEVKKNKVTLKNLRNRTQEQVSIEQLFTEINRNS